MGTVVGSWRLKLLIILFVFLLSCYTVSGFFADLDTSYEINQERLNASYNQSILNESISYNDTNIGTEEADDFIAVLGSIGGFLTFSSIENPWGQILLVTVTSICWIAIGYIIYTFIKEWIPFT